MIKVINNKICCVLAHGKSIEKLEDFIINLKDYNICWVGIGLFTIFEEFILSKINKHLDIVFDCASVADSFLYKYENKVRLPRLEKFLEREENNLWVTTWGIIRDSVKKFKADWLIKYKSKIFVVDNIFPQNKIGFYMSVPNSVCLLIAFLLFAQAKKIILFGLDGSLKENNIDTYYKSEYHKKEHLAALGSIGNTALKRDTLNFNNKFPTLLNLYRQLFNNNAEIINCSPNSKITVIKNISYEDLKNYLK